MTKIGTGLPLPAIVFFLPSFRGGGAEANTVRLANHLVSIGAQVEIVVLSGDGFWREQVDPHISVVDLGTRRASRSLFSLVKYFRRQRPPVFFSNLSHLNVLSLLANKLAGSKSKIILWEHNDLDSVSTIEPHALPILLRLLMRMLYPAADRIIAVSQGVKNSLIEFLSLRPTQIEVIFNIVDLSAIKRASQSPVGHPWLGSKEYVSIIAAGRLVFQKGFDLLIDAFHQVSRELDARLIIMGEGDMKELLEQQIGQLGLHGKVELAGFVPEPFSWISHADIFVLSSRYEGFGIVIAEAMACGTPVVAFDCPSGPAELLENGSDGILVPAEDVAGLRDGILQLATNVQLAEEYKNRGLRRADKFAVDIASAKVLDLVDALLDPKRSPRSRSF